MGVSVARKDDEGFERVKNISTRKKKNLPYLKLTLSVSVVWFSNVTVLAVTSYLSRIPLRLEVGDR